MKYIYRIFILGVFIFALFGFQSTAHASESINNFDTDITIQEDGGLKIIETITYNFDTNNRHGIFRDIPLTAENGPELSIVVLQVVDQNGHPYPYDTSLSNDTLHIKIGDPNIFISGIKKYIITYQVYNAIRRFENHDELYWNVTGNGWKVTNYQTTVSITLPQSNIPNIQTDCFTGPLRSTEKNCTTKTTDTTVTYATTESLGIAEGFTLVLGIPRGYVNPIYVPPTTGSNIYQPSDASPTNAWGPVAVIIFVIIFVPLLTRLAFRRSPRVKPKAIIPKELRQHPIITEYEPPDTLLPIEVGTILDRCVDPTDISSVIMDLATRGYIKIRYILKKGFFRNKKSFELVKRKDGKNLTHIAEIKIFELLFEKKDSITIAELEKRQTAFHKTFKEIKSEMEKKMETEEYFDVQAKKKNQKIAIYLGIVSLPFFFTTFVLPDTPVFLFLLIGFLLLLFAISGFIGLRPYPLTKKGVDALAKILGFKKFLEVTEKHRLDVLNAPDVEPELFEKYLPYAMVLGVEEKWAKKFEKIYLQPDWYENETSTQFNSILLATSLRGLNTSLAHTFHISTGTHSSGSSGGGFSGGGSGGGGGGSW